MSGVVTSSLTIISVVKNILNFIFVFSFLITSFILIYLGFFKYIRAKSATEVGESKKFLIFLVLGLILLSSAFFLPNIILNFFGFRVKKVPNKGEILTPSTSIRIFNFSPNER